MRQILKKTNDEFSKPYYIRQLIFGAGISAFVYLMLTKGGMPLEIGVILFFTLNALLYPYSRFVYESIVSFFMGESVFFVNILPVLVVKYFTMMLCWGLAVLVGPISLAYIYYQHSKRNS